MTKPPQLPNSVKFQHGVQKLQEACKMLDALNILLDEAIAQVEEENRRSPLYQYRLEKAKKLLDARSQL
jgi:hypothetical protein